MTEQRVRDLLIHHGIQDGGPQLVADILALVAPAEPDLLQAALDVDRLARAFHDSGCRRGTLCGPWGHRDNAARVARALASQDKA